MNADFPVFVRFVLDLIDVRVLFEYFGYQTFAGFLLSLGLC